MHGDIDVFGDIANIASAFFDKKSLDKLDKLGKVNSKFANFANFATAIFLYFHPVGIIFRPPSFCISVALLQQRSFLVAERDRYMFFSHSLVIR